MNLYLNIEVLNRELHSKLLIAMESASRGMNVYLGRLKPYIMRDFFSPISSVEYMICLCKLDSSTES